MSDFLLGEEQLQALDLMKEFITSSNVTAFSLVGPAGTGSLVFLFLVFGYSKIFGLSFSKQKTAVQ